MTSHLSKLQISFDPLIPMFFYAFMARTRLDIPNQIRIKSLQQMKAFIARRIKFHGSNKSATLAPCPFAFIANFKVLICVATFVHIYDPSPCT